MHILNGYLDAAIIAFVLGVAVAPKKKNGTAKEI